MRIKQANTHCPTKTIRFWKHGILVPSDVLSKAAELLAMLTLSKIDIADKIIELTKIKIEQTLGVITLLFQSQSMASLPNKIRQQKSYQILELVEQFTYYHVNIRQRRAMTQVSSRTILRGFIFVNPMKYIYNKITSIESIAIVTNNNTRPFIMQFKKTSPNNKLPQSRIQKSPYLVSVRRKSKLISQKSSHQSINTPKNQNLVDFITKEPPSHASKGSQDKKMFKRFKKFQAYQPYQNSNHSKQRSTERLLNKISHFSTHKIVHYNQITHYSSNKTMSVHRKVDPYDKSIHHKSIINITKSDRFHRGSHSKIRARHFFGNPQERESDWLSKQLINKEIYALDQSDEI